MFPEDIFNNPAFVANGQVTPAGIEELAKRVPHVDLTELKKNPDISKLQFTVNTVVNYIENKLKA